MGGQPTPTMEGFWGRRVVLWWGHRLGHGCLASGDVGGEEAETRGGAVEAEGRRRERDGVALFLWCNKVTQNIMCAPLEK
jgi:hypothetical protein